MASVHDLLNTRRHLKRQGSILPFVALALLAAGFSYTSQAPDENVKPMPEQLRQKSITGPEEYPPPERIRLV